MAFISGMMAFIKKRNVLLQNLLLACSFAFLLVFIYFRIDNLLDSDISTQLVLSKLLQEENSFLSTKWFYATELRVLGYNIIFQPLFYAFSNWRTVRFIGHVIFYIILLLSIHYFCRKVGLRKYFGLVGTVFIIPCSETYFAFTLKNINYIPFFTSMFFSIGMMVDYIHCENRNRKIFLLVGISILALLTGAGGMRLLYTTYAPLFLAIIVLIWLDRKSLKITSPRDILKCRYASFLKVVTAGLIFNMIGYMVNSAILAKIYDFLSYGNMNWTGFQFSKLRALLDGMLVNFGMSYERVFSFAAVHNIMCLVIIAASVFVIYRALKKRENLSFECILLALFITSSLFISIILYCFTTTVYQELHDIFWVMFCYPMLALYMLERDTDRKYIHYALAVIVIGLGICSIDSYKNNYDLDTTSELKKIANMLTEDGYHDGYATFWQANIMTELSNGQLDVWDWKDGSGDFANVDMVYRWAQKKSHEFEHPEGKVFWVLTEEESNKFTIAKNLGEDYVIYRSDESLNADIMDNDKKHTKYVVYGFKSYEEMYSIVGGYSFTEEDDALSMQRGRTAKSDGMLLYPDKYLVICRGENLKDCKAELSYKPTVKYKNQYVVTEKRVSVEPDTYIVDDEYIVIELSLSELANDFIVKFTNNSKDEASIVSIEVTKPFGYYMSFYSNEGLTKGNDDHGIRTIENGGMSYGPDKTLVPGVYAVECIGDALDKLTFDCIYKVEDDERQIDKENVTQTKDCIYYEIAIDEVLDGVETRFFNNSGQDVNLNSLKIRRIEGVK